MLRWQYHAQGSVNGAVVIVGDLVYASSDDDVLHALDIATGDEKWRFTPVNTPVSEPAVADGVVYAFDGSGTLFALDAVTGGIRWHAAEPLQSPSSLTVGDGLLYVGIGGGALVALDVTTGVERWRYSFSGSAGGVHNPAFADGIVYAGSDSGGFAAVDAMTGALLWHFETGPSLATAVVADGIAYIGDSTDAVTGHRYALDARTGQLLWHLDLQLGSPAVSDRVAYSGSDFGLVAAYDTATGNELWRSQVQGTAKAGAVAAGVLYIAAVAEHRVYALDGASGKEMWHFDVDGGTSFAVAVAHGSIFVGTDSGSVYNIGGDGSTASPGNSPTAPPSPTASPSAPPTASPVSFPPPVEFLWASTGGPSGMDFPGRMAIDSDGRLWVPDTGNSRFAIFDPDGTFIEYWEHRGTGVGEFILQTPTGGQGAAAFAPDGSFYALDVGNRRVEHFDKQRNYLNAWGGFGNTPGKFSDPGGPVVDAQGLVYVIDGVRGVIERYDKDGHVLGSIDDDPLSPAGFNTANSFSLDAQGNYYVSDCCSAGNQVQKLDPTGTLLTTFGAAGSGPGQFTDQPGSMGIDGAGRLFVANGPSIWIFAGDGSFETGFTAPGLSGIPDAFVTYLVLDGMGNGYVAESTSNLVEKFRLLPPFAPAGTASPSP